MARGPRADYAEAAQQQVAGTKPLPQVGEGPKKVKQCRLFVADLRCVAKVVVREYT